MPPLPIKLTLATVVAPSGPAPARIPATRLSLTQGKVHTHHFVFESKFSLARSPLTIIELPLPGVPTLNHQAGISTLSCFLISYHVVLSARINKGGRSMAVTVTSSTAP